MNVKRGQSYGDETLTGDDQSHGQTGGVVVLWNNAQSHGQTGGVAWLRNDAASHGQTGGVVELCDAAESHGMRGGTLYVRSPNAKVINHLGGTVIWQEWNGDKYVETRRVVKPDVARD